MRDEIRTPPQGKTAIGSPKAIRKLLASCLVAFNNRVQLQALPSGGSWPRELSLRTKTADLIAHELLHHLVQVSMSMSSMMEVGLCRQCNA
jgi:hypothetical protein